MSKYVAKAGYVGKSGGQTAFSQAQGIQAFSKAQKIQEATTYKPSYTDQVTTGKPINLISNGKDNNIYISQMPLIELAVDSAGYSLTRQLIQGRKFKMEDLATYAVSDLLYIYGFRDWVLRSLFPMFGLSDNSTMGEKFIVDGLAEILSVTGLYWIINMFMTKEIEMLPVMGGVAGGFLVDQMYMYTLAARAQGRAK